MTNGQGSEHSAFASVEGYDDWLDWAEELDMLTSARQARSARDSYREIVARRELILERGEEVPVEEDF